MRRAVAAIVLVVTLPAGVCRAGGSSPARSPVGWLDEPQLTGDWLGARPALADEGLRTRLSLTQVGQYNVDGGIRRAGEYVGGYGVELEFELEKLLGIPNAFLCPRMWGGWGDGVDAAAVSTLFGVDRVALGDRPAQLVQLYYEQTFFQKRIAIRIGKLQLFEPARCGCDPILFDVNANAYDERLQFLNSAMAANPSIPFPGTGLAVAARARPVRWLYFQGAVADSEPFDEGETDFEDNSLKSAFHGEAAYFYILEAGVLPTFDSPNGPLHGAYRAGFWYDPGAKPKLNPPGFQHDDAGLYLNFSQDVWKENRLVDDEQGVSIFGRYGYAPLDVNPIQQFWSAGWQYRGLIPTRDEDVLAFGFARAKLLRSEEITAGHETVLEAYYNFKVTEWLSVSPSAQYLFRPGGRDTVDHATVLGLRVLIWF